MLAWRLLGSNIRQKVTFATISRCDRFAHAGTISYAKGDSRSKASLSPQKITAPRIVSSIGQEHEYLAL